MFGYRRQDDNVTNIKPKYNGCLLIENIPFVCKECSLEDGSPKIKSLFSLKIAKNEIAVPVNSNTSANKSINSIGLYKTYLLIPKPLKNKSAKLTIANDLASIK